MDNTRQPSQGSYAIAATFATEIGRRGEKPQNRPFVDLDEYAEMCHDMVPEHLLSEELLAQNLEYIDQDSKLKQHLPAGYKICLAVLPFTEGGNPLSDEELSDGRYLKALIIDQNDKVVSGFGFDASFVNHLLPQEARNVTFTIQPYENQDPHTITDGDRQNVKTQYEQAFRKLQNMLGMSN